MNEFESDAVLERLRRIEEALRDVSGRLEALERLHGTASYPPPFVPPSPPPQEYIEPPPVLPVFLTEPVHEPVLPPVSSRDVDEIEYKIGLQGLLRGGTVVVVVALIFLVALAISRRWITLEMQFGGELILCLGFIGLGFWKRNEREEFGQLMTGIGSCGLYLSFAGAHVFKGIISQEMVVLAFVALSLANLGYALWRSSRSFLAIGMIGGLVASALPMRDDKVALDVGLLALILLPTAWIIYRNKWQEMAAAMWAASVLALTPALFGSTDWGLRIAALYGATLLACWLYAEVFKVTDFDKYSAFVPSALMIAGLLGLGLDGPIRGTTLHLVHGSWHMLVLGGLAAVLAVASKGHETARNSLTLGGALVIVLLSPTGLEPFLAGLVYAFLSVALSAISLRRFPEALSVIAWVEMGLCLVSYMLMGNPKLPGLWPVGQEIAILCAAMAATAASAYATYKAGSDAEYSFLAGSLLIALMFVRTGHVSLFAWQPWMRPELTVLLTSLVYASGLFMVGGRTKWFSALAFGWAALLISLAAYIPLIMDGSLGTGFELVIAFALMGGVLGAARATWSKTGNSELESLLGGAGLLIGGLIIRLSVVVLSPPNASLPPMTAITIGLLVVAGLGGAISRWKDVRAPVALAWPALVGACLITLSPVLYNEPRSPIETMLIVAELAISLWVGHVSWLRKLWDLDVEQVVALVGVIASCLIVRLSVVILSPGLPSSSAATIGLLVVAGLGAAITRWKEVKSTAFLAWPALLGACLLTLSPLFSEAARSPIEIPLLIAEIVATVWVGIATVKVTNDLSMHLGVCVGAIWILVSRLGWVGLTQAPFGLKEDAALTAAWIAYAIVLISLGFKLRVRHLRYWSLGVFGLTVLKVFTIDVAGLDPAVRVLLLLVLGLAMLGGGYAYIRMRAVSDKPPLVAEDDLPSGEDGG